MSAVVVAPPIILIIALYEKSAPPIVKYSDCHQISEYLGMYIHTVQILAKTFELFKCVIFDIFNYLISHKPQHHVN